MPVLDPSTWYLKDYATVFALLFGPLAAVWWTLRHQDRAQRRGAKERLFLTLMAHRRANPPSAEWTNSLNLIDVVFSDNEKVVGLWHTLYMVLETKPWNQQRYTHAFLELMSEMARSLGYRRLSQTDIDKSYAPQAHGDMAERQAELQTEFLRVLKASKNLAAGKDP